MMALIGYGIAFGLGWLLNRQVQALLDLQKIWYVYFVLAVALTIFCLTTIGTTPRWAGGNLAGTDRAALHGGVRRRSLVLGVRVRRRGGAVLVERRAP